MDEDAIEVVEYNITTVLKKARYKTCPVQTWPNYYQLENVPAQRSALRFVDFIHNLFLFKKYIKNKIYISMPCFR